MRVLAVIFGIFLGISWCAATDGERQSAGHGGDAKPRKPEPQCRTPSHVHFVGDSLPTVEISPRSCKLGVQVSSKDLTCRMEQYVRELGKEGPERVTWSRSVIPVHIPGIAYLRSLVGERRRAWYYLRNVFSEISVSVVEKGGRKVGQTSLTDLGVEVHSQPIGSELTNRHELLKQWITNLATDGAMEMSGIRLLQLTSATLRKDTYIPINPLENTDLFIIGPEDTEITVRFKYHSIRWSKVALFVAGILLIWQANWLTRSFTFQIATVSTLGTSIGFLVLLYVLWRKASIRSGISLGLVSLIGGFIPTIYGRWGNVYAYLWGLEWWQWLGIYIVPTFLGMAAFAYWWGPMEHHRSLALTGILIRGFGLVLVWGASNSLYGAIGLLLAIPTLQFLTLALQGIAAFFYERVACCNRCQRNKRGDEDKRIRAHTYLHMKELRKRMKTDLNNVMLRVPRELLHDVILFTTGESADVDHRLKNEDFRVRHSDVKIGEDGRRLNDDSDESDFDEDEVVDQISTRYDEAAQGKYTPATTMRQVGRLNRWKDRACKSTSGTPRPKTRYVSPGVRQRLSFGRAGPTVPPEDEIHQEDSEEEEPEATL